MRPAGGTTSTSAGVASAALGRLGLDAADLPALALALVWPAAVVWFGLWPRLMTPAAAEQVWTLHNQVLQGIAPSPYQYQMWIHDLLLGPIAAKLPVAKPQSAFVAVYVAWYSLGLVLSSLGSYALARRFAGRLASLAVVLQLCALLPAFWYDNYYHPGDPWGWLATLTATWAIVVRPSLPLLTAALLVAGFAWEKNATLPATLLLAAWLRPGMAMAGRVRAAIQTLPLLLAAAVGPLLPRLLYGTERAFTGARSFALRDAVPFVLGSLLLVGPAARQLWRERREEAALAREVRWLQTQLPLWLAVYTVAISALLTEIRSISVVFFYAIPLTARAFDALAGTSEPYPLLGASAGLLPPGRTLAAAPATNPLDELAASTRPDPAG